MKREVKFLIIGATEVPIDNGLVGSSTELMLFGVVPGDKQGLSGKRIPKEYTLSWDELAHVCDDLLQRQMYFESDGTWWILYRKDRAIAVDVKECPFCGEKLT